LGVFVRRFPPAVFLFKAWQLMACVEVTRKFYQAITMTATAQQLQYIRDSIKTIPDYPKPGILFRDVTSLLENPLAYASSIELLVERYRDTGVTKVVGTEARGFLFGAPVALALGVGFVPVRKPGKLPRATLSESYELEYGTDNLEIHTDAIVAGDKVLVVDDLLATGGTIEATATLIRRLGGEVTDAAFIINLPDLGGETRLNNLGINCYCLLDFAGH
jgi:adenine phosphoribosyltransferase